MSSTWPTQGDVVIEVDSGPPGPPGGPGTGLPAGGTTGQVPAKASNADYDIAWSNAGAGDVVAANNLSDLADATTARTNLGLGSAAEADAGDFAAAGHTHPGVYDPAGTAAAAVSAHEGAADPHPGYLTPAEGAAAFEALGAVSTHAGATDPHGDRAYAAGLVDDLSGVSNASAARTNLGLGTAATTAATDYATAAQGAAADGAVPKSLYDANTILYATADNTPAALPVGPSTFVGRKASGDISAMSAAEAAALLTSLVAKATFPETIAIACSDMTTAITTGTTKAYWVAPWACTLVGVKATLATAASGSGITVDINEGAGAGTSMLSTKLTIDVSETDSADATTPAVISDSSIAANGRITIDVDAVGTGAAGLIVYLSVTRAL